MQANADMRRLANGRSLCDLSCDNHHRVRRIAPTSSARVAMRIVPIFLLRDRNASGAF